MRRHALVHAQGPLSTWVVKECSGVLLQHLLLGFELGVYAPHEHCMLFWCARAAGLGLG